MGAFAIVQARMNSSRLPGKVLMDLAGHPVLWHVVNRLAKVPGLSGVVVATTDADTDDPIRGLCATEGWPCVVGSELDVLDRYVLAATRYGADPVVRVTSDCPFVDPDLVSELLAYYSKNDLDLAYLATGGRKVPVTGYRYPHGLDAECIRFEALKTAWEEGTESFEREHVTPFLHLRPDRFRVGSLAAPVDHWRLRLTVDYPEDLELARRLFDSLYSPSRPFGLADILQLVARQPELLQINAGRINSEGYEALWHKT